MVTMWTFLISLIPCGYNYYYYYLMYLIEIIDTVWTVLIMFFILWPSNLL